MKEYTFIKKDSYNELLFRYPCVSPVGKYMEGSSVWVLNDNELNNRYLVDAITSGIKTKTLHKMEYIHNEPTPQAAIIFPPSCKEQEDPKCYYEEEYYRIMNHYIHFTQMMVHKMSGVGNEFHHLLFVLPPNANQYSAKLRGMAYYALNGLVEGLGKMYAPKGIFVNGLILNNEVDEQLTSEWITFLISNNSNNIVGQNIKL
jgi:hypothetical protein